MPLFSASPPNFDQFWAIRAQVSHQILALAFFLIENHNTPDYIIALNMLRAELDPLSAPNSPFTAAACGRPCKLNPRQ